MNKFLKVILPVVSLLCSCGAFAQTYELLPLGDFENWVVRDIKESGIIGGETKRIFSIGPTDTIVGNIAYNPTNTPWATSNAYAKVMGIVKTSCTTEPAIGPSGRCAMLATRYAECKVMGMFDIKVLVAGTIYLGKMDEPVANASDPYAKMDWGMKFTKRPKAFVLDYKSIIPNTGILHKGTTTKHKSFPGVDPAMVVVLLQRRWEDEKGMVHAERVGTAVYHIENSSDGWVKDFRIPMIYGDATKDPSYKEYMGLSPEDRPYFAENKKGKKVPISELSWAEPGTEPTHMILIISSGSHDAFTAALDNVLLIDNLRLEY